MKRDHALQPRMDANQREWNRLGNPIRAAVGGFSLSRLACRSHSRLFAFISGNTSEPFPVIARTLTRAPEVAGC